MELKDIENYFFGSLVVSQDVAKEVDALLLLALKSLNGKSEEGIEEKI